MSENKLEEKVISNYGKKPSKITNHEKETREESQKELVSLIDSLKLKDEKQGRSKEKKIHTFWNTQPVPQDCNTCWYLFFTLYIATELSGNGFIEPSKPREEIRPDPYPLPPDFQWAELDIGNSDQMKELYTLLSNNYVEDEDSMFRFDYPAEFLYWALTPPGYKKEWLVGIRVSSNNKLVAFITATPITASAYLTKLAMVQVNFLCVHKKLRSKRLSPVLIKEITRRVHFYGNCFQAVYTAGVCLPQPISKCQYYHRPLNMKKLVSAGFSSVPPNVSLEKFLKAYELKTPVKYGSNHSSLDSLVPGLREMTKEDIPKVFKLLNQYLADHFDFHTVFTTENELAHWCLPRQNVLFTYVVENEHEKGEIEDCISFYSLPSSVLQSGQSHHIIKTAYLFYYAVKDESRLTSLVKAMLILCKQMNFDVFNCLSLMKNEIFLSDLKFGLGDGELNYYLYNWRTRSFPVNKVGLLML